MRQIVDTDPRRHVLLLAALSGTATVLAQAEAATQLGVDLPIALILTISILIGSLLGWLQMYVGGAILKASGRVFRGQASAEEVRAAISWSSIPNILSLVLWVPLLAIYGQATLADAVPVLEARAAADPVFASVALVASLLIVVLDVLLVVWQAVLYLKCLAEVHRFSAWRALGAVLLPPMAMAMAVAILVVLVSLFS
jgi:hypothetical protein